jgi:ABC-type enterochelin transport system substrate-binding protein
MHRTRLVLTGLAVAAALALTGCDSQSTSDDAPAAPAAAASTGVPETDPPTLPPNDTFTTKACDAMKKDIADNADKVAKAEKIGPPAGYIAVGAQWAAGAAAVVAHSIGANDTVSAAADKVQREMTKIGEAYDKSADAKPSKKNLEAAIKDLTAACSAL